MTKRPYALQDLTFVEFEQRVVDQPVILLPLGSQEEQGPHAPMGDFVLAERIALAAAKRAGAICAPVLPFGYADFFRGKPGGMQLRAETFCAVLEDMIMAFLDHGIDRVIICNGHSTNAPLIAQVTQTIRRRHGIVVPNLNLWRLLPDDLWNEVHGERAGAARGHGADPVTSVAMHLTPDLLRPDLIARSARKTAFGLPIVAQFCAVAFQGGMVDVPLDVTQVADDGIGSGDPAFCSAAVGERFTDYLVGYVADFTTHFRGCDPRKPL